MSLRRRWTILVYVSAVGLFSLVPTFALALPPCYPQKPLTYGFQDLIIQARVFGPVDRRGELSKLGKTLKLGGQKFSQTELDQVRSSVGVIFCKASGNFGSTTATAFLIGSNKEITTAGHVIEDEWGNRRDLSTCYFENFDIPPKRVSLMQNSPRNIVPTSILANDHRDDRARLELISPVEGARPFAPDFSQKKLAKGTPVVLVAAQHKDFRSSGIDPILSPCLAQNYYDKGDGLSRMKTDCDSDKGSSGGVYLIRGDDGKIYAKAMQITGEGNSTVSAPNYSPYNDANNFVTGLAIDQTFLNWYSK